MKRAITPVVALMGVSLWSTPALAKNRFDIGLLGGWAATSEEGSVLKFDRSTPYQATLGWPVRRGEAVTVSIEVPFIATPALGVVTPGSSLPKEFASHLAAGSTSMGVGGWGPEARCATSIRARVSFRSRLRANAFTMS